MAKKAIVLILIALLAAAFLGRDWLLGDEGKTAEEITVYGNIDIRQVQLGFRVSGMIHEVLLEEGDPVEPGTLLAKLESTPFRDDLALANARADKAKAVFEQAVNGPRDDDIEQARAIVMEREADLFITEQTFKRQSRLLETNAVSRENLDQAQAAMEAAQGRLLAAESAHNLLVKGTRHEEINAAEAEFRAAQAEVARAQTSLSDTELRSRSKGIVTSRVQEPGAVIEPGATVFVVSLNEPVWARAYVSEHQLGYIYTGLEVDVYTDTRPGVSYRGTVGYISPVAEFTPKTVETPELRTALVYRFRVIIQNTDTFLRQGMPVTVRIPLGKRTAIQ